MMHEKKTPKLVYPNLPIVQYKEKIIDCLHRYPVLIIAGETGSGKTTQLPKMCLEAGYGHNRKIGHTQPRRLAVRAMATRIAQELEVPLGEQVGFQVRFSDKTSPSTMLKVMTEGILLSEIQNDRDLLQYDCLILDEAHERSLNIDFLLGYLKVLLQKRSDLKLIVTSATIEVERFSQFFNDAPMLFIEGRTYPVEVRYLPFEAQYLDPALHVLEAVRLVCRQPGDILIFQSGEREIYEVVRVLSKSEFSNCAIFPLYARMSMRAQQKVFQPSSVRKMVIATNVAETSITVPGIRFVIDSGLVRMSRYNYRTRMQRLPIEPISQASAKQRMGRCGRVGPGICYRLYSESDYLTRAAYTEPEILRANLAGVLLKLLSFHFKQVEAFPFIDPLDKRYIKDGFALLDRLGAMDAHSCITPIGKQINKIPLEPKLARILIAAKEYNVLKELLIIVSGLTILDPRERPEEAKEKARAIHALFFDARSDFISYLKLWDFVYTHKKKLSHKQFRELCYTHYLSYVRICEWFDVHAQLTTLMRALGCRINMVPAEYKAIHLALLTGFIDSVGYKEKEKEYNGCRNSKFYLHPASGLFKKPPTWVVACEVVCTTKYYARVVAQIESGWIEEVAGPLLKHHFLEPFFDIKWGNVVAFERLTLFGLDLGIRRKVSFEKKDPKQAREVFIRQALVEGKLNHSFSFYEKNALVLNEIALLEKKIRKLHYYFHSELVYCFYDKQLPDTVFSVESLKTYLQTTEESTLCFTLDMVLQQEKEACFDTLYPSFLTIKGVGYPLEYVFDFESAQDGITVNVPLKALVFLKDEDFSWLIPGWLEEKIYCLIKQLPKNLRFQVPIAQVAAKIAREYPGAGTLWQVLSTFFDLHFGKKIPVSLWETLSLPTHLFFHFKVLDEQGQVVAQGSDLKPLFDTFASQLVTAHAIERNDTIEWEVEVPETVTLKEGKTEYLRYGALVDNIKGVHIRLFDTQQEALHYHPLGLARYYLLYLKDAVTAFRKSVEREDRKRFTAFYPGGAYEEWLDMILLQAALALFVKENETVRTVQSFQAILKKNKPYFMTMAKTIFQLMLAIGKEYEKFVALYKHTAFPVWVQQDIKKMLMQLFYTGVEGEIGDELHRVTPHFLKLIPFIWLQRYPIYLQALQKRIEQCLRQVERHKQITLALQSLEKSYETKLSSRSVTFLLPTDPLLVFRWKIQELRVSQFAQILGTVEPVSLKRLFKQLESL